MVAKGYKQTDIGIIPNEWEVKTLGEVLKVRHGKSQKEVETNDGVNPILGTGGLMGYTNSFLYDKPSVLIGRKGTIDKPQYWETPFWTVDTLFYTEIFDGYLAKYIYYNFLRIEWYNYNEASGVPSLNAKTIENISILIPPLPEQQAIAQALSNTDTLITNLQNLIAKKRLIKQGTMQELLTPKKGWEVKKLGEVADFSSGTAHENVIDENGKYILINSKFISTNGNTYKKTDKKLTPTFKDEILIVLSDVPNGKAIAKCFYVNQDDLFTVNQRIGILKCKKIRPKFLFYLLNRHKDLLAFDDGVKQTNLRNQDINNLVLTIPSSETEQGEIAECLTDIDYEITTLEQKLEKYKSIKQGMMQNLLTGKIRLV